MTLHLWGMLPAAPPGTRVKKLPFSPQRATMRLPQNKGRKNLTKNLNGKGRFTMNALLKKKVSMLLAAATCVTTLTVGGGTAFAAGNSFTDVKTSDWFSPAVSAMADGGLVAGVGDNRFAPNSNMTVAAFSTIVCRAAGLSTDSGTSSYWGYGAVKQCLDAGYISNHGDIGSANYDKPISREEAIAGMTKLDGVSGKAPDKTWTLADIPDGSDISANYQDAIVKAYNLGITTGMDPQGTFKPKNNLTRAQVAQLFYNVGVTKAKPGAEQPETPDVPNENEKYNAPAGFKFSESVWDTHEKAVYSDGKTYTKEYVDLLKDNEENGMRCSGSTVFENGTYEYPLTVHFGYGCSVTDPTTGITHREESSPTHLKIIPQVKRDGEWVTAGEFVFDVADGNLKDGFGTLVFTVPFNWKKEIQFIFEDCYSADTGLVCEYNGSTKILEYHYLMATDPDMFLGDKSYLLMK